MAEEAFTPERNGMNERAMPGYEEGPLCECNRKVCHRSAPKEAWRYQGLPGQYVVVPGHEEPGEPLAKMDGFNVTKGER